MFLFFRKYDLGFKIAAFIAAVGVIVLNIFFEDENDSKNYLIFKSIVFGIMAIFLLADIIGMIRNKAKEQKQKETNNEI